METKELSDLCEFAPVCSRIRHIGADRCKGNNKYQCDTYKFLKEREDIEKQVERYKKMFKSKW